MREVAQKSDSRPEFGPIWPLCGSLVFHYLLGYHGVADTRACSSGGQSSGFLNRVSGVRVSPGPPGFFIFRRGDTSETLPAGSKEPTGTRSRASQAFLPAFQNNQARAWLYGAPQPPPPGVSIATMSPDLARMLPLLGSTSLEPSVRMTVTRPQAPGCPPARP